MMHGDFLEIYCRCPLEVCEEPVVSELVVDTGILTLEKSVEAVLGLLRERNVLKKDMDLL